MSDGNTLRAGAGTANTWPPAPPPRSVPDTDIHLWCVALDPPPCPVCGHVRGPIGVDLEAFLRSWTMKVEALPTREGWLAEYHTIRLHESLGDISPTSSSTTAVTPESLLMSGSKSGKWTDRPRNLAKSVTVE